MQGGGLVRSAGGWEAVQKLRKGREGYAGDERILGSREFVEQVRQELEQRERGVEENGRGRLSLEGLMERLCEVEGVSVQGVKGGGRRAELCRTREGIAYLWVEYLGRSGRQLAVPLGVRAESVYKAVHRGQLEGKRWGKLLERK